MFPLQNVRGSCWVNAALQGFFRCPVVQSHYRNNEVDKTNPVDVCLATIWKSKGEDGLRDFFECVRVSNAVAMPAGQGTGDSHELMVFLCDKLPWFDKVCRFTIADMLTCHHCGDKSLRQDTVAEVHVTPSKHMSAHEAIQEVCTPIQIPDRLCEKCSKQGCSKQHLFGTFPKVLIFHRSALHHSVDYSSVLVLNKQKYVLFAVICYNGGHWWTYGRDLPVGNPWYKLDDEHVQEITNKQFPVAGTMRMLLYFLVEQ